MTTTKTRICDLDGCDNHIGSGGGRGWCSMTFIKSGDLSKIAKRHSDIPQDALPIEIPEPPKASGGTASQASPKSVKYAHCPFHAQDGTGRQTGLIAVKAGQFVFRDHTKRIGKVTVQCPGSGRPAPAAPGDD